MSEEADETTVQVDDEVIQFSFPNLTASKKQLASVSQVFEVQFTSDPGENSKVVKVEDCSMRTFSVFLNIIQDVDQFDLICNNEQLNIEELFELFQLVQKYEICMEGFDDNAVERRITNFNVTRHSLLRAMQCIEKYKDTMVSVCKELSMQCAKFYLASTDLRGKIFQDLAGIKDDRIKLYCVDELAAYEKMRDDWCINCYENAQKYYCKNQEVVTTLPRLGLFVRVIHNSEAVFGVVESVFDVRYDNAGEPIVYTATIKTDGGSLAKTFPAENPMRFACKISKMTVTY